MCVCFFVFSFECGSCDCLIRLLWFCSSFFFFSFCRSYCVLRYVVCTYFGRAKVTVTIYKIDWILNGRNDASPYYPTCKRAYSPIISDLRCAGRCGQTFVGSTDCAWMLHKWNEIEKINSKQILLEHRKTRSLCVSLEMGFIGRCWASDRWRSSCISWRPPNASTSQHFSERNQNTIRLFRSPA